MIEELKELRDLRITLEEARAEEARREEQYLQTEQYQLFATQHDFRMQLVQQIAELENKIKEAYVVLSKQTGYDVRDFGSVKIKEFTKVTITDQKLAITWAALNAPSCLSLTKDFEKVAKTLELPFAKVEKEYRAQIASDLSSLTD